MTMVIKSLYAGDIYWWIFCSIAGVGRALFFLVFLSPVYITMSAWRHLVKNLSVTSVKLSMHRRKETHAVHWLEASLSSLVWVLMYTRVFSSWASTNSQYFIWLSSAPSEVLWVMGILRLSIALSLCSLAGPPVVGTSSADGGMELSLPSCKGARWLKTDFEDAKQWDKQYRQSKRAGYWHWFHEDTSCASAGL